MEIGKRIKHLRKHRDMSLPKLAKLSGVSKGYLWQVESQEKANPSLDFLTRIAKGLNVRAYELLLPEESEEEYQPTNYKKICEIFDLIEKQKKFFVNRYKQIGLEKEYKIIGALAFAKENIRDALKAAECYDQFMFFKSANDRED